MNHPLRDKIARQMWALWVEENRPQFDGSNCPTVFYRMAELSMRHVGKEVDDILLDVIKKKLDNILANQAD